MRHWNDPRGQEWDVVIGRESWGALCVLFVPRSAASDEAPRQAPLEAEDHMAAETELAGMSEDEMEALFRASKPKEI